jgi:hypothetical protein
VSNATGEAVEDEAPTGEAEEGADGTPEVDHPDPKAITRKPATLSGALAIVAAVAVALLSAAFSVAAVAASAFGVAVLALGVGYGYRWLVDLGGLALLLGTILAGATGVEYVALLAAVGTVLAWDLGNNAIGIGEQLGREADTERAELLHAGATLAVGLLTAGTSYVVYQSASGGQPVTAVFFLLLAAVALISSLRL